MLKIFQTLRGKLLFSFSIFILLLITVISINIYGHIRELKISRVIKTLNEAELALLQANEYQQYFFSNAKTDTSFYASGGGNYYLTRREEALDTLVELLNSLKASENEIFIDGEKDIQNALYLVEENRIFVDSLQSLMLERGFKNWGATGKLRKCIHTIEDKLKEYGLGLETMLMIRRHEKDFFLRKDILYHNRLKEKIYEYRKELASLRFASSKEMFAMLMNLDEYDSLFTEVVALDKSIGFTTDDRYGLRYRIKENSNRMVKDISRIHSTATASTTQQQQAIVFSSVFVMVLCLILGVITALFIPRALGNPIKRLSQDIHEAVSQNFSPSAKVQVQPSQDEIGRLSEDVSYMLQQVQLSMRTAHEASEKIANKQEQLLDSLRYAEQIQRAILPDDADIRNYLNDYFVLYRPQNVVSGDFYWIVKRKGIVFASVVDCTGHGVPGAFMSMIGNTLLNKIVVQSKILSPEVILESLHSEIIEALKQQSTGEGRRRRTNEGMDIGLCAIDSSKNGTQVTFAGAKSHLYYSNAEGEIERVRGTSRSIGETKKQDRPFQSHKLQLPKGTNIFLCSDGYADQNNAEGKRFGSQRLQVLLENISPLPMDEQCLMLEKSLEQHMGEVEQRDDITVLGITL